MFENSEVTEKFILFAVDLKTGDNVDDSLDELEELVSTAGGVTVGRMIQNKESVENATYLGSGKCEELREMILRLNADAVCCDDELSPMQLKNLSDLLQVKVLDRTSVILDIFAGRAKTKEGKLQVELAQLKYRAQRLIGIGASMSRLGGGIGTRGPGETKLETDRRVIRARIAQISRELSEVVVHRDLLRKQRMESHIPTVAIVGYTNAGKSTLLNTLTDAGVLEEDKLFATLDPTARSYKLSTGQEIVLTDTVGFIRKLPHHLVNAFESTLAEAKYADVLLHVVDISNEKAPDQILTVYDTLLKLSAADKPVLTAFNKIDRVEERPVVKDLHCDDHVDISAKTGQGLDKLSEKLTDIINKSRRYIEETIPYDKAGIINKLHALGTVLEEDYREDCIFVRAYVDPAFHM